MRVAFLSIMSAQVMPKLDTSVYETGKPTDGRVKNANRVSFQGLLFLVAHVELLLNIPPLVINSMLIGLQCSSLWTGKPKFDSCYGTCWNPCKIWIYCCLANHSAVTRWTGESTVRIPSRATSYVSSKREVLPSIRVKLVQLKRSTSMISSSHCLTWCPC